jgi:hypothetical protein
LFLIIKINPPRHFLSDKYVPCSSINTIVQDVEDGMDIEYQVNPMEEYDTNNIFEPNDRTDRLI